MQFKLDVVSYVWIHEKKQYAALKLNAETGRNSTLKGRKQLKLQKQGINKGNNLLCETNEVKYFYHNQQKKTCPVTS